MPDDPEGAYDFGLGAGFYVDATEPAWSAGYRMYSYVARELPELVEQHLAVDPARMGIFGHSMGGHGALVLALRNPQRYRTVSAFAPICSPSGRSDRTASDSRAVPPRPSQLRNSTIAHGLASPVHSMSSKRI